MKKETALVTGGAGFIGSNLVEELLNQGYKVIVIDNLMAGLTSNLDFAKGNPDLDVYNPKADITDYELVHSVCKGVDYVFHLAAMNRAMKSVKDPYTANKINIDGTLNVLIGARDAKVKKVVYASSSSVYGEQEFAKTEDMPVSPITPYAIGKLAGEYYCQAFTKFYGLKTVVLRYFSVYGKRQRSDIEYAAVIPKFIESIRKGEQPVIYGDGEQTRPFTYVKDVVAANILFAKNDANEVFNIANPKTYSLNYIVECINTILGKDIKPIHGNELNGEIKYTSVSIKKAQQYGFNPKYGIVQGLAELITKK